MGVVIVGVNPQGHPDPLHADVDVVGIIDGIIWNKGKLPRTGKVEHRVQDIRAKVVLVQRIDTERNHSRDTAFRTVSEHQRGQKHYVRSDRVVVRSAVLARVRNRRVHGKRRGYRTRVSVERRCGEHYRLAHGLG